MAGGLSLASVRDFVLCGAENFEYSDFKDNRHFYFDNGKYTIFVDGTIRVHYNGLLVLEHDDRGETFELLKARIIDIATDGLKHVII